MIETHGISTTSAHYTRMGEQECRRIHLGTLEILERVGVGVHDQHAREILVKGGARMDGIRIRLPEFMVSRALLTVPCRITLYNRHKKPAVRAYGHNTYYGGGSDCLHVLDHRTGERRDAMLQDVIDAVRIMVALPEIDFIMSLFLPLEVDQMIYDRS